MEEVQLTCICWELTLGMYVRMCVCVCACVLVCVCVCACMYAHACMHVCISYIHTSGVSRVGLRGGFQVTNLNGW